MPWFWIGYSYCCLPEKSDGFSKAVHVSFDDVVWVLEDLKQNERRYESAFDNEFLAELKHMHEDYGACFTLYVFEKADGFDIGDMPVKYRKELKENASWLKWGFHWISPDFDKNISLDDFKMSFLMFKMLSVNLRIAALYRMFFVFTIFMGMIVLYHFLTHVISRDYFVQMMIDVVMI